MNRRRSAFPQRLILLGLLALTLIVIPAATAQTFTVLHTFSGPDGANPGAGLTLDRAGNLYGTTKYGGNTGGSCPPLGCGSVFKLAHAGSGWVLSPLYKFDAGAGDGTEPQARAVFGPDGTLYGTASCCSGGTVYNLRPPANRCSSTSCPWTETILLHFDFFNGGIPIGDLSFYAGDIYGTTPLGGHNLGCGRLGGCGEVFVLTPSGNSWTENVIFGFFGSLGESPNSGVILDAAGNVYGTVPEDSDQAFGLVFQLTPAGSSWNFSTAYHFQNTTDGRQPWGGLIFDDAGNLYGTTTYGGANSGGTVFQLTPSGGGWTFNLIYALPGGNGSHGPEAKLARDSAGNLYGTTVKDGAYGYGTVFKLTPTDGGWTYTSLHDFTGGRDGANPYGAIALDANGNLYGTTLIGGNMNSNCQAGSCGVVFEITQ